MKQFKIIAFLLAFLPVTAQWAIASPSEITNVPANQVCMVNDRFFGSPQIPVEVKNSTYYGCCAACKATLTNDASSRVAVDPISKRNVDKASAVIGALPDGRVIYFESAENLNKFRSVE